jgi:hypothetical protein
MNVDRIFIDWFSFNKIIPVFLKTVLEKREKNVVHLNIQLWNFTK